jgi:hypothetical protein
LFLVQVRANKRPTVGGNMLPPMESDNVLSHSKAVAFFCAEVFSRALDNLNGVASPFTGSIAFSVTR